MLTPRPDLQHQLLLAAGTAFLRPENELVVRTRPRASSLASDAREIAYTMAAVEPDDRAANFAAGGQAGLDAPITAEQGRRWEDVAVQLLETSGLVVIDRQIELPVDYPVSGHPDGRLDGTSTGVEFKHLGRYQYTQMLKKGLGDSHPEYILQAALYGHALGWDKVLFVISSQDASSIRGDMTANSRAKNPANRWVGVEWHHPKLVVFELDLRPLYDTLIPAALARARWFSGWAEVDGNPAHVIWEHDPYPPVAFPWSYSPYLARAQRDGQGMLRAPSLPMTGRVDAPPSVE